MLIFYDKEMDQLEDIDFIEAAWNRKWNEAGDFMIYTTSANWNPAVKFIKNAGRKETGIVQKVIKERKTEGEFVTISGFFAEKTLDWGCNYLVKTLKAASGHAVRRLLNVYLQESCKTAIKNISLDEATLPSKIDRTLAVGTPTGRFLFELLTENSQSFWAEPIINSGENEPSLSIIVHPYFGDDKKDSVFFGDGFQNVSDIRYHFDESGEYPSIGVVQEVQAASGFSGVQTINTQNGVKHFIVETVTEEANRPNALGACYPLKVISGNVSDIEMVSANQAAIRRAMQQQARLEMLNHYKVESVYVNTLQNTFHYLNDYDLGDICTIVFDSGQQSFSARIIEVREVYKENRVDIELVFGTPKKQKYVALNL